MYPDLADLADLNATTQHRGFARCASADAAYVGAKTPWVSNSCQAGIAKSCLRFGEEGTESSTFSFCDDTTDSYVVKFNENDIVQTTLEVPPENSISPMKRNMLFFLACLHILLASGEVYGWTALRPVLINSGMFDAYNETTRSIPSQSLFQSKSRSLRGLRDVPNATWPHHVPERDVRGCAQSITDDDCGDLGHGRECAVEAPGRHGARQVGPARHVSAWRHHVHRRVSPFRAVRPQ